MRQKLKSSTSTILPPHTCPVTKGRCLRRCMRRDNHSVRLPKRWAGSPSIGCSGVDPRRNACPDRDVLPRRCGQWCQDKARRERIRRFRESRQRQTFRAISARIILLLILRPMVPRRRPVPRFVPAAGVRRRSPASGSLALSAAAGPRWSVPAAELAGEGATCPESNR